jgi:hypothetical protein
MTMLQGPLRSPRETELLLDLAKQASSTNHTMARYSSSHLLFCYYFLFHQDPYGCRISKATIFLPSLKCEMPLHEFVGQYWDRDEWLQLLGKCTNLDFHKLAQRQHDRHSLHPHDSIWEIGPDNKKIARISSSVDKYFNVWIGPVKDWEAVFEFEGEYESANSDIEESLEPPAKQTQQDGASSQSKSGLTNQNRTIAREIKNMDHPTWLYWIILSLALHYFLYYHIIERSNFSS